jgi:hypothetical protein
MVFDGRVAFALGTGRCGTTFLHRLLELERCVASSHERSNLAEAFHRYCQWNSLNVDNEGFLQAKEAEILDDLATKDFSFEASAYLSLSVEELHSRFGARFVLLVRHPRAVVSSYYSKGWYRESFAVADVEKAIGFQGSYEHFGHFLSRIVPRGATFSSWSEMTRVGKIAWFWAAVNRAVIDQFARIPPRASRVIRIEDFDYDGYLELVRFFGFETSVSRSVFSQLREDRPNRASSIRSPSTWTMKEQMQFEAQVKHMAERFGYRLDVNEMSGAQTNREAAGQSGLPPGG